MIQAKQVHFIGIGGIGVSAAAKWWLAQGASVTGSDKTASKITQDVADQGAAVAINSPENTVPEGCDLVIYSAAIAESNIERRHAKEHGITQWSYPEFLGELAKTKKTIAISGTNGKSTTTAMIASVLIEAGLDPTVILGTMVPGWEQKNLRVGNGEWFVVEACEHMANMLHIQPTIAVITNIEEDHLDFYRDIDHIRDTFQTWVDSVETVVLNGKDKESQKIKATNGVYFGELKTDINLSIPGAFNRLNAAAAEMVGRTIGIEDSVIKTALESFKGTWRRFEHVGTWKEADIFSDYAHHPTAVIGSIEGFKYQYPDRRLVVIFEPHQHSRTHELFEEFTKSFDAADVLVLAEIYEVEGRTEEKFESSKDMAESVKMRKTIKEVQYAANHTEVKNLLEQLTQSNDIIVFMGAGSIDGVARELVG